ncbi:aspartyl/glutamyl-tRNA amidotransferase subunit A [Rhodocaloribacter litoris]|uniref:amidase family protein n=1 Tax=Rhodocaloribacter litoris TaxID=2558931 RepID=UPI001420A388|nr:amidase family protein [Rhodocaloribacter litoris]QXD16791.1 aspartyl/glutamyl-tRNA amidotransferase subunit A [Rhodocaloribacter litoris]
MTYLTYGAAREALARGETSCEALVSSFLEKIEAENDRLNVFISVDAEGARAQARALDARRARGEDLPLAGMVVAVKDVICIRGQRVTCASRMLENFTSLYDATVIERLRAAGVLFIGKTNCDEFAMGSSNENSHFGPVRNPLDPDYVPGGSSGGSAAAVAAGMCHVALGSDTGGSIRQPAAFCGVMGLKPTYGRVSRYGLVAYASSFDCIGPFARDVDDLAAVLAVMAGQDPNDATSAPVPVPDYRAALDGGVAGLRIGLPKEYFGEGLDEGIRAAIEQQVARLETAGATVRDVSLPHTPYGIATYYILTTAEASSNLARYDGVRYGYRADEQAVRRAMKAEREALEAALRAAEEAGDDAAAAEARARLDAQESLLDRLYAQTRTEGFGSEVKRRIMLGTYVLSSGYYDAYYARAQRVRTLIRRDFERAFETVDVLLTPATPTPPFRLGEKLDDPLSMYLNDVYTVTANLAGIPGLVVPGGRHPEGFPVGVQLLGPHFEEARLLRAGAAVAHQATTA